jgi:hypothetical protein
MTRVTAEPPNFPSETHGRVDDFRVNGIPKNQARAAYIVHVLFPKGSQAPYTHS